MFSNLIFCWPTGADAPEYKFEVPDTMVGSQDIDGRPAIFSIFPVGSSMFQAFGGEIAQKEGIGRAVELQAGDAEVLTIESDEGGYGRQALEFRKVGTKLFAASKTLSADSLPAQQIDYRVAMTDDGKVDYVMRCRTLGTKPDCRSQFFLFDNLVHIGILAAPSADDAQSHFEVLRSRIRSYVVSPSSAP